MDGAVLMKDIQVRDIQFDTQVYDFPVLSFMSLVRDCNCEKIDPTPI